MQEDDINALIEAALNGPDDESPLQGAEREVVSFLRMHQTVEAGNPIPGRLLYEIFMKENPKSHVGVRTFYNILAKRYTKHSDGSKVFFRLEPTCFGLQPSYSMYCDPNYYPETKGKARKHNVKHKEKQVKSTKQE